MALDEQLLLGEHLRVLDDRYRLSVPTELAQVLAAENDECLMAKERPGCLSLWHLRWHAKLEEDVQLVLQKIRSGRLDARLREVQAVGRLLSTRHRRVPLAGRGRLVIPEGFREFLGVEPGESVVLVGAAVSLELWHPTRWAEFVGEQMPQFRDLFEQVAS